MSVGSLALVLSPTLEREQKLCEQDKRAKGMGRLLPVCKTLVLWLLLRLSPVLSFWEHIFQQNSAPIQRKIYVLDVTLVQCKDRERHTRIRLWVTISPKRVPSTKVGLGPLLSRAELSAGQINPERLWNKAPPCSWRSIIPLPNCSSTQTSTILPAGFSETNTHNYYYFYNGRSFFFHAALTQSQPTQFCSSFQTIMPSQKTSTDCIFEWHSKTWKSASMLQDNRLSSYAIAWVVPDDPTTRRLSI